MDFIETRGQAAAAAPASETERYSAEVLATLAEIGEKINASLDLDEVLGETARLVKRLIDYEIFAVMLLDEPSQKLYYRFAIGYRPEVVDTWRIPVGQGITGSAAALREAVRVSDVRNDPRYINAIEAVRSELAVPLLFKGKCIGVLDIESRQVDYFTPSQQNILTVVASRLAIAIENARLFARVQKQADMLLVLNEIGREASSILDVQELLRRAAELIKRVIDYQILSILLYDDRENVFQQGLDVKYGHRVHGKLRSAPTEGIVGAAATLRHPVLVPDVSVDARYRMVNPETRSELAIPMMHKKRVVGVIDLESPQLNYFAEEHVQALSLLASHLAVSLENARLYEQVARDEGRMERELQAAQRIQGALLQPLPTQDYGLEIAARYLSVREVGGDLYDFLRYGPQQLGVALGDVSGKGTAAALYGAVAIGILRSLAPQKLQPAEMLRQMNHLVCERRIEGRFMTMCFATWQKRRRKLRVANAGQSQPLLCRNGACDKLKLVGFPLGIYDHVSYQEWGMRLDPGDVLVFHSDGLAETANAEGQLYGTDRLRQLIEQCATLSATELADKVIESVEAFAPGLPATDDRTLVIMKVK